MKILFPAFRLFLTFVVPSFLFLTPCLHAQSPHPVQNRMVNAVANFSVPDTICLGTPLNISNLSTDASTYFWNFCIADILQAPVGQNMGNIGSNFRMPVFMDYVEVGGNYYGFVVNFFQQGLTRLNFGNSLLNTPTSTYLGTVGGVIPAGAEGIQIVQNEGKWYALLVGGNPTLGTTPSIRKIEFGPDITNNSPTGTNWGNLGNLAQPIDLHVFQDGNNWYGFTVNCENNTITRFDFSNSFDNIPIGTNLGNLGSMAYPTGVFATNDEGNWRVFVVNAGNNSRSSGVFSLSRLDFGNSLLNIPTAVNLGNPGGALKHPRDLTIMKSCGQIVGFAVNGLIGSNDVVRLDFNNDLTSVPVMSSLGNTGNMQFPHSISKLFREGSDLYGFVMNVENNTMTRIRFEGCDDADFPPSTLQNPAPILYNAPGNYGINLTVDLGLSTQDAYCRTVVVVPPLTPRPLQEIAVCGIIGTKLGAQLGGGQKIWSTGETGDTITVNSSGYYWVETQYYGCVSRDSFHVEMTAAPTVDLGADISTCDASTVELDATVPGAAVYLWSNNNTTPVIQVTQPGSYWVQVDLGACSVRDTIEVALANLQFDFLFKQEVCDPLNVEFSHTGLTNSNPWWSFGDGSFQTGDPTVVHHFPDFGTYPVRLAITEGICTDTVEKLISVMVYPADIIITPDTTICLGDSKLLRTVPSLDFCWSPVDYLNNPLLPNPTTTAPVPIRYYFTAEISGQNLIQNGSFDLGNSGFTSNYTYSPGNGFSEGTYNVGSNVAAWHSGLAACNDHGTGTGNGQMLMVNGSAEAGAIVWSQSVSVQPNTNYVFSAWLAALGQSNPAQLQFFINGLPMGNSLVASGSNCQWLEFYTTWNSGQWTQVEISIVNQNTQTAGNDFALDDISFAPVYIQRDSVNIEISQAAVSIAPLPDICSGTSFQLLASGLQNYSWNNPALLSNAFVSNPTAVIQDNTEFIVAGTNEFGCTASDTLTVTIFPKPSIQLTDDLTVCKGSENVLTVTGGVSYLWQPHPSLQDNSSSNPTVTPSASTTYIVEVTDQYNCRFVDSVLVDVWPDPIFTISPREARVCKDDSLQLFASGGDRYLWTPDTGLSANNVANPTVASVQQSGTYEVQIVEDRCGVSATLRTDIIMLPKPSLSVSKSNDLDCTVSQATLSVFGASSYSWQPAATLNNPNSSSPVASPKVTTRYTVKGVSAEGCVSEDSITLKVEAINESQYWMPNAFTPNGDGLNDCFGVKYWGVTESFELSIYNRWGELIFQSKDPRACWDGRYKGTPQDAGVFVYMIRASNNCSPAIFRKGTFTLVR